MNFEFEMLAEPLEQHLVYTLVAGQPRKGARTLKVVWLFL